MSIEQIAYTGLINKILVQFTILIPFELYDKSSLLIKQDFIFNLCSFTDLILEKSLLDYIMDANMTIF